jgi:hypothetical protein
MVARFEFGAGCGQTCSSYCSTGENPPKALILKCPEVVERNGGDDGARTRDLRRDRFKVCPRWLNHLRFVSMSWGRQGPTWIAMKRPKTIHLVHAYFTTSHAFYQALAASVAVPRRSQAATVLPCQRRQVFHAPHGLWESHPHLKTVRTSSRAWSNFLNAIRFPPNRDGCARDWTRCGRSGNALRKPYTVSPSHG